MDWMKDHNIMLRIIYLMMCLMGGAVHAEPILKVGEFTSRVNELARDALGKDRIQELVDSEAQFSTQAITANMGADLADQLQVSLSSRFAEYFTALARITTGARDAYAGNKFPLGSGDDNYDYKECCRVRDQDLEYEARFFTKADTRSSCYRVSPDSPSTFTSPAVHELGNVFAQNFLDNPRLKWQYFGTEEGIILQAPEYVAGNCDTYDPRFRPWYVESSSPIPKDIVLVIDSSGSMRGNRMDIAKSAAATVVETLNPNDRIGIVRFSSLASTPPGSYDQSLCYHDNMAYAIPDNVRYLKSYIDSIQATGKTEYLPALDEAFRLLMSAKNVSGQTRDKIILFLTDGKPTDSDTLTILANIRKLNSALDNAVTIMTYGLVINGPDELTLLQAMANQTNFDPTKGDPKPGVFTRIENERNLRFDLGSYYSHFSKTGSLEKPSVSVPYIDFFGLGLVTSICDTVLHGGNLKGVACVDVRIADILGDIEYAQPGEFSYSFIIDNTGRTLIHPLMPSPFKVEDDPIFLDISVLERAPEAQQVIDSMKRGLSEQRSFMTGFTVSMGLSKQHGVEVTQRKATFFWRKIENTDLSFCLVFASGDKEVDITVAGDTENFLYHRFDVVEPDNVCKHAGRLSTSEQSSVAFGEQAYGDIRLKDSSTLTPEDIDKMKNYMSATGYRWKALKDGVKDTVIVTEKMDDFWRSQNDEYGPYVSSRFIGTENGVFRVYPGISLAVNYDHQERSWYSDAVANRDKLVMSVPYVDAFRAGIITTIGHSILEGKPSHSSADQVVGVIAADFHVAYFQYLIQDTYPECRSGQYTCFLMDESGYLIHHPTLADVAKTNDNRHIIAQEPEIASVLIDEKFLVREKCVSLGENKDWLTWTVPNYRTLEHKESWLTFELHWVAGTNVFLGVKDVSSHSGNAPCNCQGAAAEEFQCSFTDAKHCECPCYGIAQYDYCSNTFLKESLPDKTCTPPREQKNYKSPVKNEEQRVSQLPLCFDVDCSEFEEDLKCSVLSSCSWCATEEGGGQHCSVLTDCVTPKGSGNNTDGSGGVGSNIGAIAGGVVSAVVLVIIIAGVVVFCKARSAKRKDQEPSREAPDEYNMSSRPPPTAPAFGHADTEYHQSGHLHTQDIYPRLEDKVHGVDNPALDRSMDRNQHM